MNALHTNHAAMLARDGYAILPNVVPPEVVEGLIAAIDLLADADLSRQRNGAAYAIRNLLSAVPATRTLAQSRNIREVVEPLLGTDARVVRGLLFDKTPDANWKVAWHQDLSIAVRERRHVPGFGPWSKKAGIDHVQPPVEVLESMLTVRLHLDDCGPANGALRVLPGSHSQGVLAPATIERLVRDGTPISCLAPAGGAVLMRPLLLHASSTATRPAHRRVVHLEFASGPLPGGLEWYEQ
jgi:ectoine hydroxylase-related dioxygenase (phytanoyl-CoA dioxygenase family)